MNQMVSVTFSVIYFVGIVSKIRLIEIIEYKKVCFVNLNCLFVLRLNIPVNNFSVMSGRSQRFSLGLTSTVGC